MSKEKLAKYAKMDNIAESLSDEDLNEIAEQVLRDFDDDAASRREWEFTINEGLKMAQMKWEEKSWPWRGASNLKHPMTATAINTFADYTYPEIVRNDKVLEVEIIGYDYDGQKAQLASRITQFMNYQLLCEDADWEVGLDKLLHRLPAEGVVYKKVYWDPIKKKIQSELCGYKEVYVNHYVKSLDEARRVSHLMVKHKNSILSNIRKGYFCDIELEEMGDAFGNDRETKYTSHLEDGEYEIIEQHCYLDLDGDEYEEPYIVTVLSESGKILRIKARYSENDIETNKKGEIFHITPQQYFIDFHYIPAPDGTYHSISISALLLAYNKGVNAVMNQLIDAGTLSNTQGGFFSKSAKIQGGTIYLKPGQWIKCDSTNDVDLKKAIVPLEYKPPDQVLMTLLQFLVDSSKEISSITDVLTGKQSAQNVQATTIQILAEKSLKTFSAVQRRTYGSLGKEFRMYFDLNKKHLDLKKYQKVLDYMQPVTLDDFRNNDFDIMPVANPNLSSDVQRQSRAQMEMALLELPMYQSNIKASTSIIKGFLEANNSTNVQDKLPQPTPPQPSPDMIKVQVDAQAKAGKLDLDQQKHNLEQAKFQQSIQESHAKINQTNASAYKSMADAHAIGGDQDLERYKSQLEAQRVQMEAVNAHEDRKAQAVQNQHDINMSHLEMQHKQHELQMKQQQHQQQMHQQNQQMNMDHQRHQMDMQHQKDMQTQNLQFNQQNQQAQQAFDGQSQANQMGMDKYKYDNDNQLQRDQMAQDQSKYESDLGMNYLNNQQQREHERKLKAQQLRTGRVEKPPSH